MSFMAVRRLFPAVIETGAYSCLARFNRKFQINAGLRWMSTEKDDSFNKPLSENDVVNPEFINRNPRNLEFMGLAKKRKGWKFQYPPINFYHKLVFERTARYVRGWVEHSNGDIVLSASTQEFAIAKHLYSTTDVSAAENIGHVLAQRCRECGITSMFPQPQEQIQLSSKYDAFIKAMEEGGIELEEREEIVPDYAPGINYDNQWEVDNLKQRQVKATRPTTAKWGTEKSNHI